MKDLMFRTVDEFMCELEELTWTITDENVKVIVGTTRSSELTLDQMKHVLKLARIGLGFKQLHEDAKVL